MKMYDSIKYHYIDKTITIQMFDISISDLDKFVEYIKAYDPQKENAPMQFYDSKLFASYLVRANADGELEISDEFAEAIKAKIKTRIGISKIAELVKEILLKDGECSLAKEAEKRCGTCQFYVVGCKLGWRRVKEKRDSRNQLIRKLDYAVEMNDGQHCEDWKPKEPEKPKGIILEHRTLEEYLRYILKKRDDGEVSDIFFADLIRARIESDRISREHPEADMGKHGQPKEKRWAWECSRCGRDLYYDSGLGHYYHWHNSNSWCDPSTKSSLDTAAPKPDSGRWVDV